MLYILFALFLIIASNLVAVVVIPTADISRFVDILVICSGLRETVDVCSSGAIKAGVLGILAALTCAFLAIAMWRRYGSASSSNMLAGRAFSVLGCVVIIVCLVALVVELRSPWAIYRSDVFIHESAAISLGNLVWPLVLQAAALAKNLRWRLLFLAILTPLVAATPFRGVLFATVLFGLGLPMAQFAWQEFRQHGTKSLRLRLSVLALGVALLGTGYVLAAETAVRASNLKLTGGIISQTAEKLAQRLAIPLYQAHLASAYQFDPRVPSLTDEVLTKLRIRHTQSINGYLYSLTHAGDTYGETTSLYYGEGALRTNAPPFVWAVVAPLTMIIMFVLLLHAGVDVSTLVAIAIWRGSLGGLVAVLPALAIQIILLMLIVRFFGAGRWVPKE